MSSCDFMSVDYSACCRYYEWSDEVLASFDTSEESWAHGHVVALKNNKLVLAQQGDDVLGVTSPHMGLITGAHEFEWQGKYVRNKFGSLQMRTSYVQDMLQALTPAKRLRDDIDNKSQNEQLSLKMEQLSTKLQQLDCPDILEKLTDEERALFAGVQPTPVPVPVLSQHYQADKPYVGRRHRKEWVPVCYKGEVRVRTSALKLLAGSCRVLAIDNETTLVNL